MIKYKNKLNNCKKNKIRLYYFILSFFILSAAVSCSPKYTFTLLQINDTYEITALENGKSGGMARVATVKKEIQEKEPHTWLLHAGDFLSPSVYNSINYQGEKIHGRQMIEVLNAIKMDFIIMGNHEFDGSEEILLNRINQSHFTWIATNVKHFSNNTAKPFIQNGKELPTSVILSIPSKNKKNKTLKIGLMGITLEQYKKPYLEISNIYETAQKEYEKLAKQTDYVVALTHLSIDEDKELAKKLPKIKLLMGGHEHENTRVEVGNIRITKADANAKTVYIHHFSVKGKKVKLQSTLKKIDETVKEDPATVKVVTKWKNIADSVFVSQGFNPNEVIYNSSQHLDGLEKSVRNSPTLLTELIGKSMLYACQECDVAIFNGGSVRIDDQLIGAITQYDVMRILPFGGGISTIEMNGKTLKKTLEAGINNKGTGGYLQTAAILQSDNQFYIDKNNQKTLIQDEKMYKVALTDFLLTGKERNLDFLNPSLGEVRLVEVKKTENSALNSDIRKVLIEFLKQNQEK